jgi:hypothetical protein
MTDTTTRNGWQRIESPTDETLLGVAGTTHGPYAVGEGGIVLARDENGWTTVIESGPATKENRLTCVAVTPDGERLWFAGDSGALGMYDTQTGRKYDYTAPKEKTSTWEAIAVAGTPENERLCVANGSGEVLPVEFDGHGCPQYGEVTKPGDGSTISSLAADADSCYASDTNGNVFETGDEEWGRVGIENAQVNFNGVSTAGESLLVAGGDGTIYRYDRPCENWTPLTAGEATIHALAHTDAPDGSGRVVAVGASGAIHERTPGRGWHRLDAPVEDALRDVVLGETDVAVGASGTIIER